MGAVYEVVHRVWVVEVTATEKEVMSVSHGEDRLLAASWKSRSRLSKIPSSP